MRIQTLLTVALLACAQSGLADEAQGDAEAGALKAETCAACHNDRISLKDRGVQTIVAQSQAILAGDKKHPPGLAGLTEEDLADIAAYLDTAE